MFIHPALLLTLALLLTGCGRSPEAGGGHAGGRAEGEAEGDEGPGDEPGEGPEGDEHPEEDPEGDAAREPGEHPPPVRDVQPGSRERVDGRTLEQFLADPAVAAQPDDVAPIPPWSGMGRRVPFGLPEGEELPPRIDTWDLPGKVGDLPEPDERLGDDELLRVATAADALVHEDPKNLLALWHAATARSLLGQQQEALRRLTSLVVTAPGLAAAHLERGILLSDMFRFDDALAEFDVAALLEPGWDVYLNRGIALCFAERFAESEWDLWRAVEANPRDGNAYWDLAWVYAQVGDGAKAVEMLRYAARDPELFGRRLSRDKVRYDVFLSAVGDDPAFLAYTQRLPSVPFDPEPANRTLRSSAQEKLSLPSDAPDGFESDQR